MKKLSLLIFALGMFFVSCEKDQDAIISSLKIENEKLTPSYTSISVECQLNTQVAITSVFVQYSTNKEFVDYQEVQMEKKDGKYIANVDELQDNTTYYMRYSVLNRYSSMITKEVSTVKTLVPSTPDIEIVSVTDVLDKSASVLLNLKFDGGASVTQFGVCYGTSNNPSLENGKTIEAKENQTTISLASLQENTSYYVRAYAKNKVGIAYSESVAFTTLTMPKVQTNDISNIQLTSATLNATLLSNGNDSTATKGFCWSENSNPTITSSHIEVQNTTASFNYQLSNLKDETKYYVRAYAKNKLGVVYGAEKTFTTLSATKPVVSTTTVSSITYTSAKTGGNVTSDGGATVTDRGICYSTSSNPTISNSKISSGSGTGPFTTNLAGLSDGTTYFIRAYATNKKGTSYGEQRSFTTNAYGKPTVSTSSATNISYTSASVGGNVTSDGGATVTERGVCYATYSNPTTSNSKMKSGSGTGSFTANLTSLSDGTTYYVRAYAINSEGTTYGSQVTFTTKAYSTPTVTTNTVTDITSNSATISGNVTSDGGATVTERGICYSTSSSPTISHSKVTSGTGTGSFSANLTSLSANTKYYYRAYAKNSKGVSYGDIASFTTKIQYDYVDLGLSVKWATCNVGATKPEESGDYFAWGEIGTEVKIRYNWTTYKHCNGTSHSITKYSSSDRRSILELEDDAAYVNCGSSWRMPTKEEISELIGSCVWTWTTRNGIYGYNVKGPSGYSIFIPASGYKSDSGEVLNMNSYGCYWSSSLVYPNSYYDYYAHALDFSSSNCQCSNSELRVLGYTVRPVYRY